MHLVAWLWPGLQSAWTGKMCTGPVDITGSSCMEPGRFDEPIVAADIAQQQDLLTARPASLATLPGPLARAHLLLVLCLVHRPIDASV